MASLLNYATRSPINRPGVEVKVRLVDKARHKVEAEARVPATAPAPDNCIGMHLMR
jgi:hypothetical protein